jgi:HEAT repeat protein
MTDTPRQIVERHLGALLVMCRSGRGGEAARLLAARTVVEALAEGPVSIEAGVLRAGDPFEEDASLAGRLIARGFEGVTLTTGATEGEVLALAEALASDVAPVRESACIGLLPLLSDVHEPLPSGSLPVTVITAPSAAPTRSLPDRRAWVERRRPLTRRYEGVNRRRGRDRRESGERRLPNQQQQRLVIERFAQQFTEASAAGAWPEALHAAVALVGLESQVPMARRGMHRIAVRRMLSHAVLHKFAALGLTREEEREPAARVIRWMGLDGADVLLPLVLEHERAEPRRFLHEVLASIPEAQALILPVLQSDRPHEVRHAVALLGAMRAAGQVTTLRRFLDHADESVRLAAVQALSEYPAAEMGVHLGAALASPDTAVREAAVDAAARRRVGTLAMPLLALLARETRRDLRLRIIRALGQLPSADAAMALERVALTRPKLFVGGGYSAEERLEAVAALRGSESPNARATLERLVRDGDGRVRREAAVALEARRGPAAASG